ncbi:hypothetical protein D9M68_885020 [compost metagenome]
MQQGLGGESCGDGRVLRGEEAWAAIERHIGIDTPSQRVGNGGGIAGADIGALRDGAPPGGEGRIDRIEEAVRKGLHHLGDGGIGHVGEQGIEDAALQLQRLFGRDVLHGVLRRDGRGEEGGESKRQRASGWALHGE